MARQTIKCIGYASGIAARESTSCMGPIVMQEALKDNPMIEWDATLYPQKSGSQLAAMDAVAAINHTLSLITYDWVSQHQRFLVLGGDHTCAIGTWGGSAAALNNLNSPSNIGLIWIDAHMDSHTPETSLSKNIHGMALAVLLGYGDERLTRIPQKKLLPENVCLIGVRSYEKGEAELLQGLGVRIYFMDEVLRRGFSSTFEEAISKVKKNGQAYGISLDIDAIDPVDAPGTGVHEPTGIPAKSLLDSFRILAKDPQLLGLEIAEFDPHLDEDQKTQKIIVNVINTVFTE